MNTKNDSYVLRRSQTNSVGNSINRSNAHLRSPTSKSHGSRSFNMAVTAVLERGVGTRNCEGDAQRATTKSEPPSASVYDFVGEKCSRDV